MLLSLVDFEGIYNEKEWVFHNRTNPLEIYDDVELHSKFRVRRVLEVRYAIGYQVTRKGSLSAPLQVLIALRF